MIEGLAGKRVIVTAAGAGLGKAIARAFLEAGARVHICDVSAERLAAAVEASPGLGATPADVSDPAQVERLFDEARAALGGLDVLVNNAGIAGPTGPIETLEVEAWVRTVAVNLHGQFHCLRRAVPLLKRAGAGSIVNIASTAGLLGYPLRTPYAASKWAVVGLSKSLAIELGRFAIRVNAICPGSLTGERMDRVIAAEATARGVSAQRVREDYASQSSLGQFIEPEDVANAVLFLCSDAGAKITGQAIAIDGDTWTLAS